MNPLTSDRFKPGNKLTLNEKIASFEAGTALVITKDDRGHDGTIRVEEEGNRDHWHWITAVRFVGCVDWPEEEAPPARSIRHRKPVQNDGGEFECNSYWSNREINDSGRPFKHKEHMLMLAAMPGTPLAANDRVTVNHPSVSNGAKTIVVESDEDGKLYRVYKSMLVRSLSAEPVEPCGKSSFELLTQEQIDEHANNLRNAITEMYEDRVRPHLSASDTTLDSARFFTPFYPTKRNTVMKFEKRAYLGDNRLDETSDDDIFKMIAGIERDIEKLEAIQNKPQKLVSKIEEYRKTITQLVKYVDKR